MKKMISIILTAVMCPMSAMASQAAPSDWARDGVERAENIGIISEDFKLRPQKAITREDFCTLAFGMIDNSPIEIDFKEFEGEPKFMDTDNKKVGALCEAGIIDGRSATLFAPDETLTREEAAVILSRMVGYMKIDVPENKRATYSDDDKISSWAKAAVEEISGAGIMNGVGDNLFLPNGEYTEEQSVVTMMRLYDLILLPEDNTISFADRMNAEMPEDKNYVFSPYSIKTALALAANGAEGETKQEILDTAGITDLDGFNAKAKEMSAAFSENEVLQLNSANSIWINSDKTSQKFSADYQTRIKDFYGGEARTVTDKNAVKEVKKWISEKTNGKITDVPMNEDFWAMLVNAVYFRGLWMNEFYEGNTKKAEFTDRNGRKSEIDFMNQRSWYQVAETDGARILAMPYMNMYEVYENNEYVDTKYINESINMYIILNDSRNEDVEKLLNNAIRKNAFKATFVALSLPKFKVQYNNNLTEILNKLGVKKAFEEDADFKSMFDKDSMFITNVAHGGYISIDEKGTEAAAVTMVGLAGTSLPPKLVEFKADRPFTFVIRDDTRNEILFMGEYAYVE